MLSQFLHRTLLPLLNSIRTEFSIVRDTCSDYFNSTPNVEKFLAMIINSMVTFPADMVDSLYLKQQNTVFNDDFWVGSAILALGNL